MDRHRTSRWTTLLGLSVDDGLLHAAWVRRKNGSFVIIKSVEVPLANEFLSTAPETLGRELRRRLDEAGVREFRCAVTLPLNWISTVTVPVPDLPEADVASFLELEAERGFLFAQDSLAVQTSRARLPDGTRCATMAAVSRNHLQHLERLLQAAKLRPATFTPGLSVLQSPEFETGSAVLALALRAQAVELQVTVGGGVVAYRSLDVVETPEDGAPRLDASRLNREVRVTLGQLPAGVRPILNRCKVFGPADLVRDAVDGLTETLAALRVEREAVTRVDHTPWKGLLTPGTPITPAALVAIQALKGTGSNLEFLPPRVSAWRHFTAKVQSRRLAWGAAALALLVLGVGGAFARQQWQLSQLQREWNAMRDDVDALMAVQDQIKQFRPWYDGSLRSLRILRNLTEAFPEMGVVTAQSIEIRDEGEVICSGVASRREAILEMLDRLSSAEEVDEVKVNQITGSDPMQFSFHYLWEAGGERDR